MSKEQYIAGIKKLTLKNKSLDKTIAAKNAEIERLKKSIPMMRDEIKQMQGSKIYMSDPQNGIKVERITKKDSKNVIQDQYIEITIDLTKHANPDAYAKRIEEICNFIFEHKQRTIQCVRKDHNKIGNEYIIQCEPTYSYTMDKYHAQHPCRWFEIKSFIFDIIELKEQLETTYKEYPVYIDLEQYSFVTKKDESIPCPQAVLMPVAFIYAFLKGVTVSNFDETVVGLLNKMTAKREAEGFGLKEDDEKGLEEEKEGLEKIKLIKDLFDKKQSVAEIKSNENVGEIMKCRDIPKADLADVSKFKLGELLNCGAHGAVFRCTYEGKPYAVKQCLKQDIEGLKKESFILANCKNPFIVQVKYFCESEVNLCKQAEQEVRAKLNAKQVDPKVYRNLLNDRNVQFGYMLMQECDKKTLEDYVYDKLEQDEEIDDEIIKTLFGQFIHACIYLIQQRRMVHRDLKPENVLLQNSAGRNPIVKLCDFGFCRTIANEMTTQAGTPLFCDARIGKNEAYGAEADLFSLGTILYFLKYGRYAYVEYDEDGQIIMENDKPAECEELDIPEDDDEEPITDVLYGLLEKNHADRMTWEEFMEDEYVQECLA